MDSAAPAPAAAAPDEAALDKTILNTAILTGGLELLPQSLASMAVIPLQMRLVYNVGRAYGFELDRGHVKDLLATLGIGLTSQYLEAIGRKLLGGLLKQAGGGLFGSLGRQATGSAFAFATTYALGHVAKRYYASGRRIDAEQLRSVFQSMLGEAKGLQSRSAGEIQARARTIDPKHLLAMIQRGIRPRRAVRRVRSHKTPRPLLGSVRVLRRGGAPSRRERCSAGRLLSRTPRRRHGLHGPDTRSSDALQVPGHARRLGGGDRPHPVVRRAARLERRPIPSRCGGPEARHSGGGVR